MVLDMLSYELYETATQKKNVLLLLIIIYVLFIQDLWWLQILDSSGNRFIFILIFIFILHEYKI